MPVATGSQTVPVFTRAETATATDKVTGSQSLLAFAKAETAAVIAKMTGAQAQPANTKTQTAGAIAKLAGAQAIPVTTQTAGALPLLPATMAYAASIGGHAIGDTSIGDADVLITPDILHAAAAQSIPAFGKAQTGICDWMVTGVQTIPAFGTTETAKAKIAINTAQTVQAFTNSAVLAVPRFAAAAQPAIDFNQAVTIGALDKIAVIQVTPAFDQHLGVWFLPVSPSLYIAFDLAQPHKVIVSALSPRVKVPALNHRAIVPIVAHHVFVPVIDNTAIVPLAEREALEFAA